MARVYIVTEAEMQLLLDQLRLQDTEARSTLIAPDLSPDEKNRLTVVHRSFHFVAVKWAQAMGFNPR